LAGSSVGVMGRGISLAGVDETINWLHIVRELLISSESRCMDARYGMNESSFVVLFGAKALRCLCGVSERLRWTSSERWLQVESTILAVFDFLSGEPFEDSWDKCRIQNIEVVMWKTYREQTKAEGKTDVTGLL
jgi:hypothetical protein